jgi:hypothetical protein
MADAMKQALMKKRMGDSDGIVLTILVGKPGDNMDGAQPEMMGDQVAGDDVKEQQESDLAPAGDQAAQMNADPMAQPAQVMDEAKPAYASGSRGLKQRILDAVAKEKLNKKV